MPDLATYFVFPFFLLFARVGSALSVFPGFADTTVNPRTRMLIALSISMVMFLPLQASMPALPDRLAPLLSLLLSEVFMGILLGLSARMLMSALTMAGELIAFSIGFQAASLFDPRSGSQTLAPALFLSTIAILMIFITDLHHQMIEVIYTSYAAFPPGTWLPIGDVTQAILQLVENIFVLGVQLAAPMMAIGFLGYMAFGIFNRIIPQLHAFFLALPITIIVGLMVMSASLGMMFTIFTDQLSQHLLLFELPELP